MSIQVANSPLIHPQSQPKRTGSPTNANHASGSAELRAQDVILTKPLAPNQPLDARSASETLEKVSASITQGDASLGLSLDPERVAQLLSL
ncbi:MAG: hypothetical protein PWQ57_3271 [Desulfovibrionales bacterium]|jgi:hypothetical protein|nr:hypothetical protein [Desulfovibrionales bacterium]